MNITIANETYFVKSIMDMLCMIEANLEPINMAYKSKKLKYKCSRNYLLGPIQLLDATSWSKKN